MLGVHTSRLWLVLWILAGEGVKFGLYGGGSRVDPPEYIVCLPQQGLGLLGVACGRGAAA
jgi:hypothetical protein